MERVTFNLLTEPTDNLYRDLIDHATGDCEIALLVVRQSLSLDSNAKTILARLEAFLKQKERSPEWPGTRLLGRAARVFQYSLEPECATILKQAADALYGWRQPSLPEDLCLLRDDKSPWLVSIAHERDGFLRLSQDERRRLLNALPMFEALLEGEVAQQKGRDPAHARRDP